MELFCVIFYHILNLRWTGVREVMGSIYVSIHNCKSSSGSQEAVFYTPGSYF